LGGYVIFRTAYVTIFNVIITLGNFQWELNIGSSLPAARSVAMCVVASANACWRSIAAATGRPSQAMAGAVRGASPRSLRQIEVEVTSFVPASPPRCTPWACRNTLVTCQALYVLNCRYITMSSLRPSVLYSNKFVPAALVVIAALQALVTYTPGIQDVWGTGYINGIAWLRILGLSAAVFLLVEIEKALGPRFVRPYVLPIIKRIRAAIPAPNIPIPTPWRTSSASALGYPTPLTPRARPVDREEMDRMSRQPRASSRTLVARGGEAGAAARSASARTMVPALPSIPEEGEVGPAPTLQAPPTTAAVPLPVAAVMPVALRPA
jgi:hypothetical protein